MEQGMLFDKIKKIGIVPVVKLEDAQDAKPLAKALCDGGLPCAEVTFRTEQAADAIKNMKEAYPEMLVGAGTVLTTSQVNEAVNAGAEFIVSPGLNPEVVEYCSCSNKHFWVCFFHIFNSICCLFCTKCDFCTW